MVALRHGAGAQRGRSPRAVVGAVRPRRKAMTIRLATAMLVLVAGAIGTVRAQQATFSSRIDAVRVDVLVTDANGPIRGLGPGDFEIRDNGVIQQIDLVSFEQVPLNVVLALDMSDSVAGDRLDRLRAAGSAILGGLQSGDQAALVTFSHIVRLAAKLSAEIGTVRTALARTSGDGSTSLVDGVFMGM